MPSIKIPPGVTGCGTGKVMFAGHVVVILSEGRGHVDDTGTVIGRDKIARQVAVNALGYSLHGRSSNKSNICSY